MNVQELRAALHEHAEHVEDIGAPARVAATHERVVVVRRHRRAGVAAVVAAAVIAVVTAGTLTLLPHRHPVQPAQHPTPAKLAGFRVSPRFDTGGWHFRYAQGVQTHPGQQRLDLTVPASKQTRVLGWGVRSTALDEHAATLLVDGVPLDHAGGGEWTTGDVLAAGGAHHLSVTFRHPHPGDRAGIAVFDLRGRAPAGVSNGATTFRRDIAGDRLLGARLGDPGQSRVTFDVTVPDGDLRFATTCSGAPAHDQVRLSVNGHELSGSGCGVLADLDPGPSGISRGDHGWGRAYGIRPGATLHLTLQLLGRGQRPALSPHVVLGAGVYALAPAVARVAGWPIPALAEGPGGTYRYVRSVESRPGQRSLVVHLPAAPVRRDVEYATHDAGKVLIYHVGGQTPGRNEAGTSGSSLGSVGVLRPGRPYTVTLEIRKGLHRHSLLGLVVRRHVG